MRNIIIFIIIILVSYIPWYAIEYTHPDGSHISITLPEWLPGVVEKTVRDKIRTLLPSDILNNTLSVDTTVTGVSMDSKNWEHTIVVEKIYTDESITSILITSYEYTGGAHGSTARIGLVMDTTTGQKITLDDLYNTKKLTRRLSPIWQQQIMNRVKQSIWKKLSSDDKKWIHDGATDIQQYQSFVITPRTLIVYGQQYQHNAYAYGMQTLLYPRAKLRDIAK